MSVLVRDMKIPKNCMDCPLFESLYHYHGCHAKPESFNDRNMWNFAVSDRPSWCPLAEVPAPHGRLIDVDAFSEEMKKRHKAASDWYDSVEDNEMLARAESTMMAFTECRLTLDAMQTIIEAEEET